MYLAELPWLRALGRKSRIMCAGCFGITGVYFLLVAGWMLMHPDDFALTGALAEGGGWPIMDLVFGLGFAVIAVLLFRQAPSFGDEVKLQLDSAALAERIGRGELAADPLFEQPRTKRNRLPGRRADDFRGQLIRVDQQLNWYLSGDSRHITNLSRIAGIVLVLLLLMCALFLSFGIGGKLFAPGLLLVGLGFLGTNNFRGEALADYLHDAWFDSTAKTGGVDGAAPRGADLSIFFQEAKLHQILNGLELNLMARNLATSHGLTLLRGTAYALISLPLLLLFAERAIWASLPLLIMLLYLDNLWARQRNVAALQLISVRLVASDLALRLSTQQIDGNEAIENSPAFLRAMLRWFRRPELRGNTLRSAILNVADNLDWYLQPQRPLVRWHWFLWLGTLGGLVVTTVIDRLQVLKQPALFPVLPITLVLLLVLGGLFATSVYRERQLVWHRALLAYLREHLLH